MPKSKRAKLVSLTQTKQHRRENKSKLLDTVRAASQEFAAAYVFSLENLRSERFKELRVAWSDSRFFLGKNRLMALALTGQGPALDALANDVRGSVGLLFTNRAAKDVATFFDTYGDADFARSGFVPSETIKQAPGALVDMPHTMLDQLRKLGMPVRLDKGTLILPQAYSLCTAGKALTPEQGRLLKHFGHKLAVFRIELISTVRDGAHKSLLSHEAALKRSVFSKKDKQSSSRRVKRAAGAAGGNVDEIGDEEEEDGDEEMDDDDDDDNEEESPPPPSKGGRR